MSTGVARRSDQRVRALSAVEDELALYRPAHRGLFDSAKEHRDREYVQRRDQHRREWTGTGFRPDPQIAAGVEREWREWVGDAS